MSSAEWANTYRWLPQGQSAIPGKYSTKVTPWVVGMLDALDDPKAWKVVCKKSAQVGWTDGVWNNYLGRLIHLDPKNVVLLFPKEKTIRRYLDQKFNKMIEGTPELAELVDIKTTRSNGNRQDHKEFPGGAFDLVASNAPDNVKSLSAPIVAVEEPDDCSQNVAGQGDSIKLLEERSKTFPNRKVVFGGTPTVKGVSTVDDEFENSDQRFFMVPCHECGERHALTWDNMVTHTEDGTGHPVYCDVIVEKTAYACPHCGSLWSDVDKNRNVRRGVWVATKPFRGVAGFYINELYSPFPGSKFARLMERYLEAEHSLKNGDESDKIVFVNSCLGLSYQTDSDVPDIDVLRDRALDYPENTVPNGGLILTMGVDVQHNRLAIVIRAWGRGEESWLVYWGEIYGNTLDKNDPVWMDLESILFRGYEHESGASLHIRAATIDSSDGQTCEQVYHFVRRLNKTGLMAGKGASEQGSTREIFSIPRKVDPNDDNSKAANYGLQVYQIGTNRAKDLMNSRLKLSGNGPGRMHNYSDVRADYYEQITAEVKVPHRSIRGRFVYRCKSGIRNEGTDCEVMAMHAARSLKVHLMTVDAWDVIEKQVKQSDLFAVPVVQKGNAENKIPDSLPSTLAAKGGSRVVSKGVEI